MNETTPAIEITDPRVLFAAERTLLAWNRTSLSFMAFGFVIERSAFLVHSALLQAAAPTISRGFPFWFGIAFIALGIAVAAASLIQYRRIFCSLKKAKVCKELSLNTALVANAAAVLFGFVLILYLFLSTQSTP